MPLYEYLCDVCGHQFEVIRKFSDPPLVVCPKCGGTVQKLISAPAFQLKGTGWYATDYPKKDAGGKTDAASGDSSASGKDAKADGGEGGGKGDKDKGDKDKSDKTEKSEKSEKKDSEKADKSSKADAPSSPPTSASASSSSTTPGSSSKP